jgi:isoamylase
LRFNEKKLVLDPYAKAIARYPTWSDAMFDYKIEQHDTSVLEKSELDNLNDAPLAMVVDDSFDWEGDQLLNLASEDLIIYEIHVKGFTQRLNDIDSNLRGTYSGLSSDASIKYLKELGVTAVELLPVHAFVDDAFLIERNLKNYWGYSTLSFFAPHLGYATEMNPLQAIKEFKEMVKKLHLSGIEVILDVVFNHSCEGNRLGPTLSFRGIDNPTYYRSLPSDAGFYLDFTGCGNTLDASNAITRKMIIDSLKYWTTEMHIDGFRFDLASCLGRDVIDFSAKAKFFEELRKEPSLEKVKLIAEPWDLGMGGYQVGGFPKGWSEWNGRYRDDVRQFWKGDEGKVSGLAYRLCGSEDIYKSAGRSPHASINFVTSHDGFTLNDLVSYNEKHNEQNKENNKDGDSHNSSWNCGAEGESQQPLITSLRERQRKNLMVTLFLSKGIPMLTMGDELGRTQKGNNNAYCQDNELSWMDWDLAVNNKDFLEFVKELIGFRKKMVFPKKDEYFNHGSVKWFQPSGEMMTKEAWGQNFVRSLGMHVQSESEDDSERKNYIENVILVNAAHHPLYFKLPKTGQGYGWKVKVDTSRKKNAG